MPHEEPPSPFSRHAAAAIQIHEMFQSFLGAGFTEAQAMELVKHLLTNRPK